MSIAHITLATQNVARTSSFFQHVFGWKQLSMPANVDIEAHWLEIVPGQQMHILGIPGFKCSPFEEEFGRHFAFFHPSADYDALLERARLAGTELIAPLRPTPFRRIFFRDPNGYMIEVIDQGEACVEA
jgi:catechol 2,3-dioxygenase-like lactoylglutathione lyase family enzyme